MSEIAVSPAKRLAAVIEAKKEALAKLIPHKDLERFMANVLSELRPVNAQGKPNALLRCSPESFYSAAYQSAVLGLQPGKMGEVYMVPYGPAATLIIGYKGLIKLALRHPDVLNVHAEVIYKGDHYRRDGGTGTIEHHSPLDTDRSDDAVVGAYCWVSIRGTNEKIAKDLNREQIEKLRARSAAANGNFWKNDYQPMCRKTVIRHLFNGGEVPMSAAMEQALVYENEQDKMADVIAVRDEPRHSIVGKVTNAVEVDVDPTCSEDSDSANWSEVDEPLMTAEELELPPPPSKRTKEAILADIAGLGARDDFICNLASDVVGKTVVDLEKLTTKQLESVLGEARKEMMF